MREPLPYPPENLPEEDGINLESDWHRLAMTLLIELVVLHRDGRDDFFVGGNMFIYFDANQMRDQNFRGPDFFFVKDAPLNPPRRCWAVWNEGGKYPDMIIELTSPSTADVDFGVKKTTYERIFHTSEYFIYDPAEEKLLGWRLDARQRYRKIQANDKGRLWCEQLDLWLGTWKGKYQGKAEVYLRFFDKDGNLIPSLEERLHSEQRRATREQRRADAAEAELRKLRAQKRKPAE